MSTPRDVALGRVHGAMVVDALSRRNNIGSICGGIALILLGGVIVPSIPSLSILEEFHPQIAILICAAPVGAGILLLAGCLVRIGHDRRRTEFLCRQLVAADKVETWHEALAFDVSEEPGCDDTDSVTRDPASPDPDALAEAVRRLDFQLKARLGSLSFPFLVSAAGLLGASLLGLVTLGSVLDMIVLCVRLASSAVFLAAIGLWLRHNRHRDDLECIRASLSGGRHELPRQAIDAIAGRLASIARAIGQQTPVVGDVTKLV